MRLKEQNERKLLLHKENADLIKKHKTYMTDQSIRHIRWQRKILHFHNLEHLFYRIYLQTKQIERNDFFWKYSFNGHLYFWVCSLFNEHLILLDYSNYTDFKAIIIDYLYTKIANSSDIDKIKKWQKEIGFLKSHKK